MPRNPFARKKSPQEQEFERDIAGFSNEKKMVLRTKFSQKQARVNKAKVDALAGEELRAQQGSPLRRVAGSVGAAGINLADSATLGFLPQVVGAVGGDAESVERGLEVAQQTNPVAFTVGSLGGLFTGAAGAVGRGASKLGAAPVRKLGEGIFRVSERGFTARATNQITQNITGGGAALGATRLLEDREDDANIGERLSQTMNEIGSPLNLAVSLVAGGAAARLTSTTRKDIAQIAKKYEDFTGEKLPADVLTDASTIPLLRETARRVPGFAGLLERTRNTQLKQLNLYVRDIGRRAGAAMDSKRGGAAVRTIRGRVTRRRRAEQRAAIGVEGPDALPPQVVANLRNGLAAIRATNRGPKGVRESTEGFDPVVKSLLAMTRSTGATSRRTMTVKELEAIRKKTASVAFTKNVLDPLDPRLSSRSRKEARDFYHVIRQAIDDSTTDFARAMETGKRARAFEAALPAKLQGADVDSASLSLFWKQENLLGPTGKLAALKQHGAPEELAAAKGFYFEQLLSKIVRSDDTIDPNKLKKVLAAGTGENSRFNKQALDEILPGAADELTDLARLTERMRATTLSKEGAELAKTIRVVEVVGAPMATTGLMMALYSNGMSVLPAILGTAGLRTALTMSMRNALSGPSKLGRALGGPDLQEGLRKLATGTPGALGPGAVAAQETGLPGGGG